MSPEDLATVRDAYDAFGRGDMDALERLLHPDIEWRTTPEVPFLGTYKGLDEFLRGMNEWTESFDELTTQIEDFIDAGECALGLPPHARARQGQRRRGGAGDLAGRERARRQARPDV
jgi:ketosteroid isomerase-like protein